MIGAVVRETDTRVDRARARVKKLLLKKARVAQIDKAQRDLNLEITKEEQGRRRADQRVELQREAERERISAEAKRLLERENAAEALIQGRAPVMTLVFEGIKVTIPLGQRDDVERQTAEESARLAANRVTRWWKDVTVPAARTVARGGIAEPAQVSLYSMLEDELRIAIKRGLVKLDRGLKESR